MESFNRRLVSAAAHGTRVRQGDGEATQTAGRADPVAFARPLISNPGRAERFWLDAPSDSRDARPFEGGDDCGYTDYPTLAEDDFYECDFPV
jgi:N-ethylmaleimide reductase